MLEEVPGLVHAEDQSGHLNKYGFWSSFNELYYAATARIAGVQVGYYYDQVRFKLFDERQVLVNSSLTLTPTLTPTLTLTLTLTLALTLARCAAGTTRSASRTTA